MRDEKSGTILEQIIASRRRQLEEARSRVPLRVVQTEAEARADRREFRAALAGNSLRIIAELKRASPSRGLLRRDYRRRELALAYQAAGAAALSVLTEERYFLGSVDDLRVVREAVKLPVLCKDFILADYQVYESVAAGADALLLIVGALTDHDLRSLLELSGRLRVDALVEVHTQEELDRAAAAGARIIGVNNRDLRTLRVDLNNCFRLREKIPSDCIAVAESGIKSATDLRKLMDAGFHAALVGERFMSSPDPGRELAELLEATKAQVAPQP
jgi:indole-3-glycerol phosphate synthase